MSKPGDDMAVNLKDAPVEEPVEEPKTEEPVVEDPPVEEPAAEDEPVEEPKDDEEEELDMVAKAQAENDALKKQLEDLKNSQTNVFEQNEILKAELAEQEKLVEMAKENEKLQAQLDTIKRNSIIDSLVATGSITNDLRDWAGKMPLEDLQVFAKHAPKRKTILDQKNDQLSEPEQQMEEWKKEQSRSRIL